MFVNEKTPLRGSNNYVPYSFMGDREGPFKRKVRQYQCLICVSVLLTCALLVVLAILLYPEASDMADDFNQNDLLQLPLKKATPNLRTPVNEVKKLELEEIFQKPKSLKPPSLKEDVTLKKLTSCSLSKYRFTNGMCNNLAHPTWGASGQPFNRLIPPDYCNGISTPRCSLDKNDLPSPYFITSKISSWNDEKWQQYVNDITGMTMLLWGAFIYQDMIDTPEFGLPKQSNLATSFLDGSNLYGNSVATEKKVRSYFNGELILDKYKEHNSSAINSYWKCESGFLDFQLFDKVMIKQHNFIAFELKKINPLWDDDKLFSEAKRIVAAQIQHITYNQFLEYIIGEHQTEKFDLKSYPSGYNKKYDETVDPTISNVFAATAFKSVFAKLTKSRIHLRCDYYSLAHDIQRGRDYGIPSYIKWREFCGLPQPTSFDELYQLMGTNNTNILKEIYSEIEDIDLLIGIISEIPVEGSMFGEVGICLIYDQFKRLKSGDRYWYETDEPLQKFSEEQLMEIRKTTITGLICDNLEMNGGFLHTNTSLECPINSKINFISWSKNGDNLVGKEKDTYEIIKLRKSLNDNVLSTKNTTVVVLKQTVSLTMNVANITATLNGSVLYDVYNQKAPILLPLDRVIDPNAYTSSTDANFRATVDGNIFSGSAIVPVKNSDGPNYNLIVRFEADVAFKWGKIIELDGKEVYQCKVLFQSYTKSSNPNVIQQNDAHNTNFLGEAPKATDQCTIMLVGMFYQRPFYCSIFPWWCLEGQFFYWSGDMKMVFKSTSNNPNNTNLNTIKTGGLKTFTIKQKTENVKVDKEFASVTVVSGQISGNFETNDTVDVPISPPLDIYLDHIISPSAFDTSFEVTFSAIPSDDSSVNGQFSMAYFPIIGKGTKKTVKANFNFDFVYKYGGSIGIIEPSKTYTCKVMFPSVKKGSLTTEEIVRDDMLPARAIKRKTPFGESCAIMLSGYFQTPSFYCYLTPWWCTEEKIFHWNGDAELTFKYKYNTTNNDIFVNHPLIADGGKKQNSAIDSPFQYNYNDFEDKIVGHRLGGKVRKGWVQVKNSGLFQPSKTIWSGELPTTIDLPIFWTPGSSEDQVELSDVFGHEVIWSCSVFQSTLQGTFSFPQYVGHGPPPLVNWKKGKFYFELDTDENVSIYNVIVPGMSYRSRVNFHEERNPNFVPFVMPQRGGPSNDYVYQGIRAPLILLGKYSLDRKSFSWNGSFIIVFTKSAKDFMLF